MLLEEVSPLSASEVPMFPGTINNLISSIEGEDRLAVRSGLSEARRQRDLRRYRFRIQLGSGTGRLSGWNCAMRDATHKQEFSGFFSPIQRRGNQDLLRTLAESPARNLESTSGVGGNYVDYRFGSPRRGKSTVYQRREGWVGDEEVGVGQNGRKLRKTPRP